MIDRNTEYQINNTTVRVTYGDITQIQADVLVSSDDSFLSMTSGVSAAILRAGGESIKTEACQHTDLNLGDVAVTSAGNLAAKYIFHAITIKVEANHLIYASEESIQLATLKCLQLADSLQMKTIAFPALGTGVAKFPLEKAAEVMIEILSNYLKSKTQIEQVTITLYPREGMEPNKLNNFFEPAVNFLAGNN
jgi:O-acetyl-ADP-ribose deacetylase (regulator of RNase III)